MTCRPRHIVRPPQGKSVVKFQHGNTADIVAVIQQQDAVSDRDIDATAAACLRGRNQTETLENIFRFVKGNIRYRADRPGTERVKSPAALFGDGVGDCKSYSIAIVALARALGISNLTYRFTAYEPGDVTHVYPVARVGGRTVILDAVYGRFDRELSYHHKKDVPAARYKGVSGVHGVGGTIQDTATLFGIAAGLFMAYKLLEG